MQTITSHYRGRETTETPDEIAATLRTEAAFADLSAVDCEPGALRVLLQLRHMLWSNDDLLAIAVALRSTAEPS